MDKRFAIFDMDGTLVSSMQYWRDILKEYLGELGITDRVEETGRAMLTMTLPQAVELLRERYDMAATEATIREDINRLMAAHYANDVTLKPGVADYLEALRAQGVTMAVASATTHSLIDRALTRLGVSDYFDFLLSCEAVGASKTDPAVFLAAADRLGAAPGDIAVYEDAPHAARTARDAGFYTVGIFDEPFAHRWPDVQAIAHVSYLDWPAALSGLGSLPEPRS